jgi:hypothetical protein
MAEMLAKAMAEEPYNLQIRHRELQSRKQHDAPG